MLRPTPAAPFDTWPLQMWEADTHSFAWYARPAVFVTQTSSRVVTRQHAELAGRAMDVALERFADEIAHEGGLMVLHDWRTVELYETEARRFYSERIKGYAPGTLRASVVATNHNPIVRALVQLVALVVPLNTDVTVELVGDPGAVLARHGITPVLHNPFLGVTLASSA